MRARREGPPGLAARLGAKVSKAARTSDRTPTPVTPPRPERCVTGELAHHTAAHRELTPPRTALIAPPRRRRRRRTPWPRPW